MKPEITEHSRYHWMRNTYRLTSREASCGCEGVFEERLQNPWELHERWSCNNTVHLHRCLSHYDSGAITQLFPDH